MNENEMNNEMNNEIKLVRDKINYSGLIEAVKLAVKYSFTADGEYHKYLQDFGETFALLVAYTNYHLDENKQDALFEEVMTICHSAEWRNNIIQNIDRYQYIAFVEYVDSEIDMLVKPFAKIDSTIDSVKKALDNINAIIGAVDIEKLKEFDYTNILNAIDKLNAEDKTEEDVSSN